MRAEQLCSRGPRSGHTLARLRNPLLPLALLGQRPTPQDSPQRQPGWKLLLGRQGQSSLRPLLARLSVPTNLMQHGSKAQGKRQAEGVRQLLGQGERVEVLLEGLVWIAKKPQRQGLDVQAAPSRVMSTVGKSVGALLL